jgi:hypothetical protein
VNMDLAQLSSIVDNEVLPSLRTNPWDGNTDNLGSLTSGAYPLFYFSNPVLSEKKSEFVRHLGILIEDHLNAQNTDEDVE